MKVLQFMMYRSLLKLTLLVVLILPFSVSAFTVPEKPTGFVQDYAKILSEEQVIQLELKLENYEKFSTNEIAVVAIQSLDGDTIENVAQEIFTKWGIGKKDKNNGVLFLISVSDRQTRIHTGYGVEGDLTDIGTSYIQRDVVTPAFRAGDYYAGINGAVDKMIESLGGTNIVPDNYSATPKRSGINWNMIFIMSIILIQFVAAMLGKSKSWWAGGVLGGAVGVVLWIFGIFALSIIMYGIIFVTLVFFGLAFDFMVSKAHDTKNQTGSFPLWFWFLGGGGRGGSGGSSGGGFGGGGSGGGGSSGRW